MAIAATNRKPVLSSNATISRLSKYPATKVPSFNREFHSRRRGCLRFSLFVRASVLKKKAKPKDCFGNDESSGRKEVNLSGHAKKKPKLRIHEKEKKLSDEEEPISKGSSFKEVKVAEEDFTSKGSSFKEVKVAEEDPISKGSSFKEVKVAEEDLVKGYSSTWGIRNGQNGENSRLSLLSRSPCSVKKQKPRLRFHEKEKIVIELSDEEDHLGDSISKGSSFNEVPVGEDLAKEDSSTCGVRNYKNENSFRESLLRRSPRLVKKRVFEVSHEPLLPLEEKEEADVKSAFSVRNRKKLLVLHKTSNISICGETLHCLKPCAWLNDEVINVYLGLLKERETREPQKYLKCHFFNTFFYTKLTGGSGYDYEAVRRWTSQRKLGYNLIDCDIIFVPIHGGLHWTLAVINIRERKFQYLDSLKGFDRRILMALARYLVDEVKDKSGKSIDVSLWDMEYVKDLPQQLNGYDCGMFMLKYIDYYSKGLKLHFSQKDMPYFRLRTAKEILRLRAD